MFVQDGFLYLIVTRHKLTVYSYNLRRDFSKENQKQNGRPVYTSLFDFFENCLCKVVHHLMLLSL
jgi:hypothetical protein